MWYFAIGIVLELIILIVLSERTTRAAFIFFLLLTKSRTVAITFITLWLFPGTVVHELSHLFTAEILGVHTGKLTVVPESIDGQDIQSGSVEVAKTGPCRRTLIGIAPTLVGTAALSGLSYWLSTFTSTQFSTVPQRLLVAGIIYLILTVSTTMFSSKEDLKGALPVAILIVFVIAASYLAGFRFIPPPAIALRIEQFIRALALHLGIVVVLQLLMLLIQTSFILLLKKARHL